MDVLFVNPGNAKAIYQDLAKDFAAIEPPTWALLLAQSVRSVGFSCGILDVNAERLTTEEATNRITALNPKLICFVVYGQNVNAGTVGMSGAVELANHIKSKNSKVNTSLIGSYIQALPLKTLKDESSFDFGFTNEGVYALRDVLKLKDFSYENLKSIAGLVIRKDPGTVEFTPPGKIVPSEKMDEDLPGYAWDLLPFVSRPLDLYRSPMWHAEYREELRSPYAAIQTSLGCNFGCAFCMINIVNRVDNEEIGIASSYKGMRFWSTDFILRQFDILNTLGVSTIRIVDEMFLLYKKHYVPLCEGLSAKHYAKNLRLWSYSRIDTIKDPDVLKLVRSAGIKWLCLGIESGRKDIRLEVSKGKFEDVDINTVIMQVHGADIEVMANYIVGLPGDTFESMQETLDLSLRLNTLGWNMYAAMALPGSELYRNAVRDNVDLPDSYEGFSFHSFETLPLPTSTLTPGEILKFRDEAFLKYHSHPNFLRRIREKFGENAEKNILEINKVQLKRRIYTT